MQITIATCDPGPDGRPRVSFEAKPGTGGGVWRGAKPQVGGIYQVEFTVERLELWPYDAGPLDVSEDQVRTT